MAVELPAVAIPKTAAAATAAKATGRRTRAEQEAPKAAEDVEVRGSERRSCRESRLAE